ncbi:ATP-binding protein [Limnobacter sp.]|uniref:sensor histidine kinase n=1 Tax=Limnobacter sp. TaxID=2003368 RepID=UPI003513EE0E
MLAVLLRLLSFFTGQPLASPKQLAQLQSELGMQQAKTAALEELNGKLRAELKTQQQQNEQQQMALRLTLEGRISARQQEMSTLREAYEQLARSVDLETQRQIRENNALLNQLNWLSGTIAHDFRAPLRAIDAYSFFLADDLGANAPPEAEKSLEEIRRNGKRMGVLLDALIEYLRLGVCPLNLQTHSLQNILEQVVDEHFDFSPVPIEIQVSGQFKFDKALVMRLFKELIDNAVKFAKPVEQPRVQIRMASPNTLEIIDNGVGFSQAHDAQKFRLFHRMHGNDEFEGEGIGLAMAERIATRHHWTLQLARVGNQTVASLELETDS